MALKVHDVMSTDVCLVGPDDTIQKAAMNMGQYDAGIMPVAENDRMIGMITDRDIAVRAVAQGRGPDAKVREVMSNEVRYCYDDEDASHVSQNMAELQVRRLPVVNREKRLVGIVSIGDLSRRQAADKTGETVRGVSEPGGQHSQTAGASKEKVGA